MKDKVIAAAGRVWKTLGERGPVSITELTKILKMKTDIVNQAIGWLAREDKIKYIPKGSRQLVSLVETEQQMFKILKDTPLEASKK